MKKAVLLAALIAAFTQSHVLAAVQVSPAPGSLAYTKKFASAIRSAVTPTTCTAQTVTWTGVEVCTAPIAITNNDENRTVAATNGTSGSATFRCNAATDSYINMGGSSCTTLAAASATCASDTVTWFVGSTPCSGTAASTTHGSSTSVADSAAPNRGSAVFACQDGAFYQINSSSATCSAGTPCQRLPSSPALTWGPGCSSTVATTTTYSDGQAFNVSDQVAPQIGDAVFVCNNGTISLQSSVSCVTP